MNSTGSDPSGVRVEVLTDLGDLSGEWDRLVDSQPIPSPFLKSWWISNAGTDNLTIVCVFRSDRLVGGAAFESGSWGPAVLGIERVRTVGSELLAPDHLDLISTAQDRSDVTRAVLAYLLRKGNRLIDLNGLRADGSLAAALDDAVTEVFDAPFAFLPSAFDTYLAARPGKLRSTIKRRGKQLGATGAKVEVVEPEDLNRAVQVFSELHDTRWADESGFLSAMDRFRAVLADGVTKGEVRITELRLDSGETIAIEIDFEVAQRLSFYQSGRRTDHEWRACGTVLRSAIIESAISRGVTEYDMLRGDENYKADWATDHRQLTNHRLPVGLRSRVVFAALSRAPWLRRP
ncbi:MAG: GNAT family N-acetyltransferase [Microthrixaceae bacterium]|nr:GNAT family N-acetyltransferase [Microthrixaceae bacterium]